MPLTPMKALSKMCSWVGKCLIMQPIIFPALDKEVRSPTEAEVLEVAGVLQEELEGMEVDACACQVQPG